MKSYRREYIDQFLELNRDSIQGRILDIGGKKSNKRGRFHHPLQETNDWKYLNIDPSTNPDFLCSSDEIPVEAHTFDTVLCCEVIEHLESPEKTFAEAFRVLKVGGIFLATVPFLYAVHADPSDFQRFTGVKLEKELKEAGFQKIQVLEMGGAFAAISDILYKVIYKYGEKQNPIFKKSLYGMHRVLSSVISPIERVTRDETKEMTTGYFIKASKGGEE